ncbi:MAG: hypothetical protein LC131_09570 [Anaerolineae bacterium]|nr:hypothetical protein [Anaerolineae bacterium]
MRQNLSAIRRLLPLFIFMTLVPVLLTRLPARAAGDNHAAVVVDFGDGQVATRCVSFAEDGISGYEALLQTDLAIGIDLQTGGAAVCSINDQGCPSDDCFCSCPGGNNCLYWSYWIQNDGAWSYSAVGAGLHKLHDGEMSGWVWGQGSVTQATPPPAISFDDVCTEAVAGVSTSLPPDTVAVSASETNEDVRTSTAAPPDHEQPYDRGWRSYIGYGVLLLFLGVLTAVIYRRRGRTQNK